MKFMLELNVTLRVRDATAFAARPLERMAALQLVAIARYSSSLRLALHPMEHTANAVQLRFLGWSHLGL